MFTKSCEYALQAILYIALHSKDGKCVGLKEISKSQQIPHHFLSKILQQLVRHRILTSVKGPNGGFALLKSPEKVTLLSIVQIIDGHEIFDRCGIGLRSCQDKNPCPIHFEFKNVKQRIKDTLSHKTLSELADDVKNGHAIVSYH